MEITLNNFKILFIITLLNLLSVINSVQVSRPRGVALTKKVFYDSEKDFTCIDGTATLSFTHVNDDFCDCTDGSDEPGTSACPNGVFHCTNAGHRPINIPSSRVNDGICDCCDATDEYNSSIQCANICREMGRIAREEAARLAEVLSKGHEAKKELSVEGKRRKEERKSKLEELTRQRETAEAIRLEKESAKLSLEEIEKTALDRYKSEEDEKRKLQEEEAIKEKNKNDALLAFTELDENSDGRVNVEEIKSKWVFDSNKDGEITDEEAKFFLNGNDEMDYQTFVDLGWLLMKPHYSMIHLFKGPADMENQDTVVIGQVEEIDREAATAYADMKTDHIPIEESEERLDNDDGHDNEDNDDDEEDNDDEEEEVEEGTDRNGDTNKVKEEESDSTEMTPSPYDEETQELINAANAARNEYEEANRKVGDLDKEIKDVNQVINIDFGEDDQFAPIYSQCFEHEDREYIYKLCLFDLVSQRPKSGGSDINLGRWQSWIGPEDDLYSRMKYDHGLSCWNGPARSTEVYLSCGVENKLISVSEPNKCVYLFEFETPAVCRLESSSTTIHHSEYPHEEL